MAAPVLSRGTTFALIAFGVSWATWLPLIWWTPAAWLRQLLLIGGTFGPSIAAVVLLRMGESHAALGAELKRHWRWRLPIGWWLFILGGPAVLILMAIAITHFLGVPAGEWNDAANLYLVVPVLAYVTVLGGPLGEELGWRGYAFARLQRRFRPVTAALAVGVVWGL